MNKLKLAAALMGATALSVAGTAQAGGVTKDEILLGTHSVMSGPVAVWGVPSVNGMRMRFEEVNAKGGIHGRKIKFIVEDSAYQVPKAVQASNKLINRDKIFAMVGAMGTPQNNAVLPKQLKKNIPNLFPFTAARQMAAPFHKLKFASLSTYYDQTRAAVKYFAENKGAKNICEMYQDTDFGREIHFGAVDQTKEMGLTLAESTAHKPTATDFAAAIAKLRKADCDIVLMGTIVRDTILPYATARKIGWDVDFVGTVATYSSFTASAKGGVTEGFMAMTSFQYAYPGDPNPLIQNFAKAYKEKFGKDPDQAAQLGYISADLVVAGLDRAGKDLTVDSLVKGLESLTNYKDIFGGPVLSFGPNKRLGSNSSFLSVVEKGRWKRVSPNLLY